MTSISLPTPSTDNAKRPYVAPTLVVHGDVKTLTQGGTGNFPDGDGGSSLGTDNG